LEFSVIGVIHHPVELRTLFGAGAGDAFVCVDLIEFPVRPACNVFPEKPLLCIKGVGLILFVRGYTAVAAYFYQNSPLSRSCFLCC